MNKAPNELRKINIFGKELRVEDEKRFATAQKIGAGAVILAGLLGAKGIIDSHEQSTSIYCTTEKTTVGDGAGKIEATHSDRLGVALTQARGKASEVIINGSQLPDISELELRTPDTANTARDIMVNLNKESSFTEGAVVDSIKECEVKSDR